MRLGSIVVLGLLLGCGASSPSGDEAEPVVLGGGVAPPGDRTGDATATPTPAEGCPATLDAAEGQLCAEDGVVAVPTCDYAAAGSCRCAEQPYCSGDERVPAPVEDYVWVCERPPPEVRADGCPGTVPEEGSPCELVGKRCGYGDCCVAQVECTADGWGRLGPAECPA